MSQEIKIDSWKNIKKLGIREILKHPITWDKVKEILEAQIYEKIEGKDLYERNQKLWHEIVNFLSDLKHCINLKQLFESGKLETIYTEYLSNRSDYNGNHGQITMQYAHEYNGKYEINGIRLHCLGMKETKNGFVYMRHGGNYSFEHDVVSSLNYLLFDKSDGFKQRSL